MSKIEKLICGVAVVALGIVILLLNDVFLNQTRMGPYQYQYYTTESLSDGLNPIGQVKLTNFEENFNFNHDSSQLPDRPSGMGPWMLWVDPYYHYSNPQKVPVYNEYIYTTNDK